MLMYVPIVYGFLPEINVFVFVNISMEPHVCDQPVACSPKSVCGGLVPV